ncbi:MAG: LCP family protein [Firmicutes bacterium]|nr:LCP family protein [Bacillota bacterium]MCL5040619.1 LCP family protein [Bacillota bacterium]
MLLPGELSPQPHVGGLPPNHSVLASRLSRHQGAPHPRRKLAALVALAILALFLMASFGPTMRVLIMGVDERPGDKGRSDTLILTSVSPWGLSLLSLPRDLRVSIPGRGLDKINAAYPYGGPGLSLKTVSEFLRIPVTHYLKVNFGGFERIIDQLGGITLEVEKPLRYSDPYQNLKIDLKPGKQTLDGYHALGYVRFRSDELGDINRMARQQKFFRALLQAALEPRNLLKLPLVVSTLRANTETNLSLPSLLVFVFRAVERQGNLKTATIPGHPATINGIWYLIPDN